LFDNKINNPEIFEAITILETLEKFYIGSNLIDVKLLPDKNKVYLYKYFYYLKMKYEI